MAKRKTTNPSFLIFILIVATLLIIISYCNKTPQGTVPSSSLNVVPTRTGEDSAEETTGYRLSFPEDFNRSLASQDDLGISILIALDCSGSMGEKLAGAADDTPKYKVAAASLSEVIVFFENFYSINIKNQGIRFKLGLIRFASDIKVLYPLTEMKEAQFAALKKLIADPNVFSPGGRTAIGKTLETGSALLAQAGTIFKSFIIITDGENTEGIEPATVLTAIVENRNNKNTRDFPVLTSNILVSFIGFDLEASVFLNLNTIGSRVMSAFDKEALKGNLKNLFLADIKKLEAE